MIVVLLAVLFVVGFVAQMVWVVRAQQRSNVAEVDRLGRALGLPEGSPFLVERHGRTFTARYAPAYKSNPASLTVIASVDEVAEAAAAGAYRESGRDHVAVRPRIVLRNESMADRLAHRLGVNREVKTGDAAFDGAVYIVTDSPEEDVQRTLASPDFREAVRALLAAGATYVQLNFEGLTAMLVGPPPYVDRFEPVARGLAQAAAALPLFQPGTAPRGPSVVGLVIASLTALSTIVGVPVVALAAARPPLAGSPVLVGVGSGLALWILATLAARWRLRGRSTSLGLILMFAILGPLRLPGGHLLGGVLGERGARHVPRRRSPDHGQARVVLARAASLQLLRGGRLLAPGARDRGDPRVVRIRGQRLQRAPRRGDDARGESGLGVGRRVPPDQVTQTLTAPCFAVPGGLAAEPGPACRALAGAPGRPNAMRIRVRSPLRS